MTSSRVDRRTVDLSGYPDLLVIYFGMRSNTLTGVRTLLGFRPKINTAVEGGPDGLLRHEWFVFSLLPPHIGFRQYWRDWESMEAWARSEPHREWWRSFLRGSSGTGFWHETYFRRHDMEAVYDDMKEPVGLLGFAPNVPARGGMFSARRRAGIEGSVSGTAPVLEEELYRTER